MEAFRVFLPLLADVLVRRQAAQRLEPSCETLGHEEGVEMSLQQVMGFVGTRLQDGIFQRPVHPSELLRWFTDDSASLAGDRCEPRQCRCGRRPLGSSQSDIS